MGTFGGIFLATLSCKGASSFGSTFAVPIVIVWQWNKGSTLA